MDNREYPCRPGTICTCCALVWYIRKVATPIYCLFSMKKHESVLQSGGINLVENNMLLFWFMFACWCFAHLMVLPDHIPVFKVQDGAAERRRSGWLVYHLNSNDMDAGRPCRPVQFWRDRTMRTRWVFKNVCASHRAYTVITTLWLKILFKKTEELVRSTVR